MDKLEISINNTIDDIDVVRKLIATFESRAHAKTELLVYDWGDAWKELMQISLYHHGPVISEVGETWMGSLASRNCLRPFTSRDLANIGTEKDFLNSIWQNCLDLDGQHVVGIPWSLDTYLLYYRRDLLEKAGIDEDKAFTSLEALYETLAKLVASGAEYPLAIPTTANTSSLIHNASSWVWARGGHFVTPDGSQVLLSDPRTMAGLKEYFGLYRFMPACARLMDDNTCDELLVEAKPAVTLRFVNFLGVFRREPKAAGRYKNIGITVLPAHPFIGGSTLTIWNHIPPEQEAAAVEFIRYLTSPEASHTLFANCGLVPARLEALAEVEKDPGYAALI
jgi:ABC-type glycerol-3-phosphate transport system substrate-binding protein